MEKIEDKPVKKLILEKNSILTEKDEEINLESKTAKNTVVKVNLNGKRINHKSWHNYNGCGKEISCHHEEPCHHNKPCHREKPCHKKKPCGKPKCHICVVKPCPPITCHPITTTTTTT